MYYFDTPILSSEAAAVVIPVSLDAVIKPGTLQYDFAEILPEAYRENYIHNCRNGRFPQVFVPQVGPWIHRTVWNLPALPSQSSRVLFGHVMRGLAQIVRQCAVMDTETIAIPYLCPEIASWDMFEESLFRFEQDEMDQDMELWLYPPQEQITITNELTRELVCL